MIAAVYLAAVNLLAFLLMGIDKRRARRNKWRISERTLFLFPVLGGTLGGIAGMVLFHHKTRHWYFRLGLPALLAAQLGLMWLVWRGAGGMLP